MSVNPTDQSLIEITAAAAPQNIDDVIDIMTAIDAVLPGSDGLKWFNWLYLTVTKGVDGQPPAGDFNNLQWVSRLDVIFAQLYFAALHGFLTHAGPTPSSWQAIFEARHKPHIERIQFALTGINAHINHDLALALLQTNAELNLAPAHKSPEHQDYERVNNILEAVLPQTLMVLAAGGLIGELAQDTGKVGQLLAIWKVGQARDLAWDFADHLKGLDGLRRRLALAAQDKLTGVIGRSLLLHS
jgi:hypothetical protein